jgi:hypothetical protein
MAPVNVTQDLEIVVAIGKYLEYPPASRIAGAATSLTSYANIGAWRQSAN